MTFSIPTNKIKKIKYQARKLASRDKATPREIAKFLGYLNYLAQAIVPERLRTRALYTLKDKSLQMGDWDTPIPITNEVQEELRFWMGEFIMHNGKPLIPPEPAMESASDASKVGYGAYCYQTKMQLAGVWSPEEAAHSSNWRELEDWLHHTDNTPTVAYINKQGGPIKELSEIARRLWLWAIARNISITAAHLPGIQNTGPDKLSRMGASWKEWMIQPTIFKMLNQQYGPFEIDLFASTMNYQLPTWVSLTKMLGASASRRIQPEMDFTTSREQIAENSPLLDVPPIQSDPTDSSKDQQRGDQGGVGDTGLASSSVVPNIITDEPSLNRAGESDDSSQEQSGQGTQGPSQHARMDKIARDNWKDTTRVDTAWRRFVNFCQKNHLDHSQPSPSKLINFMHDLHEEGLKTGTVTGYKSAIASIWGLTKGVQLGDDPVVRSYVKAL
uniref:Core-binding (CB) domain-containing protein n=1 Tax=Arcella intermedia TaxID=1963864 RepID=A0A6B2L4I1_9EUKA